MFCHYIYLIYTPHSPTTGTLANKKPSLVPPTESLDPNRPKSPPAEVCRPGGHTGNQ